MRWKTYVPKDHDRRTRNKFTWLPLYWDGTTYWLESIVINEIYYRHAAYGYWLIERVE